MAPENRDDQLQLEQKQRIISKRKKITIWSIIISIFLIMGIFGITAIVGWGLTHPPRMAVDTNPGKLGLKYENVTFQSRSDKLNLKGWLIKASNSNPTIIFAHGYSKNRLQKDVPALDLAKDLVNSGYNVLMFDFRNAGESEGEITSVGQYEVLDLLGAVDYVKSREELNDQIVLLGISMGASTAILAGAREPAVTAVIADSPFADLTTYLETNLPVWTHLPRIPFNQTFFLIVPSLTGLDTDQVSPIKEVKNLQGRPLLLIHGNADEKIPLSDSKLIKEAYSSAQLVEIDGADHVKSYSVNRKLYLEKVLDFLEGLDENT